jgi:hypothetical protein
VETLGLTLDFWGRIEHFLLMSTVNRVQFYPRNPGLNLGPGSTNSSRIAPLVFHQSTPSGALIHELKPFRIWLRILKEIRQSRLNSQCQ